MQTALSSQPWITAVRIRSFGPEPPPDDLLPEATCSAQQLGRRLEEFNEGWQALLAPCGRLSPGSGVRILHGTATGHGTGEGGAGDKQPPSAIQWPAAPSHWPQGPCSFLQQPAGQQNHPACSGRAKINLLARVHHSMHGVGASAEIRVSGEGAAL